MKVKTIDRFVTWGVVLWLCLCVIMLLSACTPSTATHHALHEGRDVERAEVSMVNAPGKSSDEGVN